VQVRWCPWQTTDLCSYGGLCRCFLQTHETWDEDGQATTPSKATFWPLCNFFIWRRSTFRHLNRSWGVPILESLWYMT